MSTAAASIVKLRTRLERLLQRTPQDIYTIYQILLIIRRDLVKLIDITYHTLIITGIGKTVKKLANHDNSEISKVANPIFEQWRKVHEETPKDVKDAVIARVRVELGFRSASSGSTKASAQTKETESTSGGSTDNKSATRNGSLAGPTHNSTASASTSCPSPMILSAVPTEPEEITNMGGPITSRQTLPWNDGDCFCQISFLPAESEDIISCSKCKNPFHIKCLFEWLKKKKTCPMCRAAFGDDEVIRGLKLTSQHTQMVRLSGTEEEERQIKIAISASTSHVTSETIDNTRTCIAPGAATIIDLTSTHRAKDYAPMEAISALINLHKRGLSAKNKRNEKRRIIKRLLVLGMSVPKFRKNW